MEPFTEYYVLLAFARRAEGSFSYRWYDNRFTEVVGYNPQTGNRTYNCTSVKNYCH
jgi:hypothetical protein